LAWRQPERHSAGYQPQHVALHAFWQPLYPQPGAPVKWDAIGDLMMFRAAYRNFGSHESIAANHTVKADGTDRAGVRWYELVIQAARPPFTSRAMFAYGWSVSLMGSMAMDHGKHCAGLQRVQRLGISVNSLCRALATDPLGTLPQAEAEVIAGTGSQTGSVPPGRLQRHDH
jgi:hypothetical protein